jgi:hypothetical protein
MELGGLRVISDVAHRPAPQGLIADYSP